MSNTLPGENACRPLFAVSDCAQRSGALIGLAAFAQLSVNYAARAADAPAGATDSKVDLNTATDKDLENLPGVGPSTAKKIIAGRPYASVDDLSKSQISAKEVAKLTPLVTVSGGAAPAVASPEAPAAAAAAGDSGPSGAAGGDKVDLNTASDKDLENLPGVGTSTLKKIIAGRPYASVDDLSKSGISAREIAKLTPLVTVSGNAAPAAGPAAGSPAGSPAAAAAATPSAGGQWSVRGGRWRQG